MTKITLKAILKELESLSDEKTKKHNTKSGVDDNQFGVKLGDLRKVAKKIKLNHELALQLWETENFDAQMLAMLIIKPNELSADELDTMVRSLKCDRVADWMNSYVVKEHRDNEKLRRKWMKDKNPMAARAGWNLTSQRVARNPEMVDIPALLNRIEKEMAKAAPEAQWTMNFTLAGIGIHHPEHRQRAIDIGEKLGIYRDYPVSKGCTSPFAPIWIEEMVSRQGQEVESQICPKAPTISRSLNGRMETNVSLVIVRELLVHVVMVMMKSKSTVNYVKQLMSGWKTLISKIKHYLLQQLAETSLNYYFLYDLIKIDFYQSFLTQVDIENSTDTFEGIVKIL